MTTAVASDIPAAEQVARRELIHRAAARNGGQVAAEHERPQTAILLPADLLGGDESVIFIIKPSPWYIVFDSANWLIASLCLIACASLISEVVSLSESQFMSAVLTVLALRVGLALLRWVSRFYVLTNRRIMRVRGVIRPDIFECPLLNIRNTAVTTDFPEAMTRLGTLNFVIHQRDGGDASARVGLWQNLATPHAVHAEVRKAIERAIDSQPHL